MEIKIVEEEALLFEQTYSEDIEKSSNTSITKRRLRYLENEKMPV